VDVITTLAALALAQAATAAPDLTALLDRVRMTVPDARSLSDLQVCPPTRVSSDGSRYTVMVAFARRGQVRRYYGALWRDGRYERLVDTGLTGEATGLLGVAARSVERRFEACRWVPAAEIEAAWAVLDGERP
jgi:hypothetical protein